MGDNRKAKRYFDLVFKKKGRSFIDFDGISGIAEISGLNKCQSILFSRGYRSEAFFTEDSKLYVTPFQYRKGFKNRFELNSAVKDLDSLKWRVARKYLKYSPPNGKLLEKLQSRLELLGESLSYQSKNFIRGFSLVKVWNLSLVGAILFGMLTMTLIYRYLGPGASAVNMNEDSAKIVATSENINLENPTSQVLGEEKVISEDSRLNNKNIEYISNIIENLEKGKKEELEGEIRKMVKGYPIEKMAPLIAEKDKIVAAFIIGIAKKESNWGKRVPLLNGRDCYNYWGYRGVRKLMGTGGHTCFNSREDAVDTVAKRLEWLIKNNKLNTPAKMSIWKCGSKCSQDSQVGKWISDVDLYFRKLNK
jgi:hypothetical protein